MFGKYCFISSEYRISLSLNEVNEYCNFSCSGVSNVAITWHGPDNCSCEQKESDYTKLFCSWARFVGHQEHSRQQKVLHINTGLVAVYLFLSFCYWGCKFRLSDMRSLNNTLTWDFIMLWQSLSISTPTWQLTNDITCEVYSFKMKLNFLRWQEYYNTWLKCRQHCLQLCSKQAWNYVSTELFPGELKWRYCNAYLWR